MSVTIKVVTFNLRCNTKHDEFNMFDNRKGLVLAKIDAEKPDIIGFQEMKPDMRKFLAAHLPEYHIVGRSRSDDYTGEHVDIAYRKDTLEVFGLDFFWLSPTPYVPGSRYEDQSTCPRITTSGIFKHKDLKTPFRMINTHLDHIGESARVLGMTQILNKLTEENAKFRLPTFITGDMNATPDSETIKLTRDYTDMPLVDLTADIPVTFHGFGRTETKIDYIITDAETAKGHISTKVWDDCNYGLYLSDHHAVEAVIEMSDPE